MKDKKGCKGGKGRQYKAEGGGVRTGTLPAAGMGYGTGGSAARVRRPVGTTRPKR